MDPLLRYGKGRRFSGSLGNQLPAEPPPYEVGRPTLRHRYFSDPIRAAALKAGLPEERADDAGRLAEFASDFVPVGEVIFDAGDAKHYWDKGHYIPAAISAAAAIMAGIDPVNATSKGLKNFAKEMATSKSSREAVQGIVDRLRRRRVYQGAITEFDQFKDEYVGSGVGLNSHGGGHYFAEGDYSGYDLAKRYYQQFSEGGVERISLRHWGSADNVWDRYGAFREIYDNIVTDPKFSFPMGLDGSNDFTEGAQKAFDAFIYSEDFDDLYETIKYMKEDVPLSGSDEYIRGYELMTRRMKDAGIEVLHPKINEASIPYEKGIFDFTKPLDEQPEWFRDQVIGDPVLEEAYEYMTRPNQAAAIGTGHPGVHSLNEMLMNAKSYGAPEDYVGQRHLIQSHSESPQYVMFDDEDIALEGRVNPVTGKTSRYSPPEVIYATHEAQPGPSTGHLPDSVNADRIARDSYFLDPRSRSDIGPGRKDYIYADQWDTLPSFPMRGVYGDEMNLGMAARPQMYPNVRPGQTRIPDPIKTGLIKPGETLRAAIEGQDAGAAHATFVDVPPRDLFEEGPNALVSPTGGRTFGVDPSVPDVSVAEIEELKQIAEAAGYPDIVDRGDSVMVTNFQDIAEGKPLPPVSDELIDAMPKSGNRFGNEPAEVAVDSIYVDLTDKWAEGLGSGAVTREVLDQVAGHGKRARDYFNNNEYIPQAALMRLVRDHDWQDKWGIARADLQNFRAILAQGKGWIDRLEQAMMDPHGPALPIIAGAVLTGSWNQFQKAQQEQTPDGA